LETEAAIKQKPPEVFVEELEKLIRSNLSKQSSSQAKNTIIDLLKSSLKNKLESVELHASWVQSTSDLDIKLTFARLIGDESRHFRLIEDRLKYLSDSPLTSNSFLESKSAFFEFFNGLEDPLERVAATLFTWKGILFVKNQEIARIANEAGDPLTAQLVEEMMQQDEEFHHELGRRILNKHCQTPEIQKQTKKIIQHTLSLLESL